MENNPINTNNPINQSTQPTQQSKDQHGITIAAMALFILTSLGVIIFLYYQNQQLKTMLASYKSTNQQINQSPDPTPNPTANWKTYSTADFSLKYPNTLIASSSGQTLFLYIKGTTPSESETFVPSISIGNKYALPKNFTDLISWAKANPQLFPDLANSSKAKIGNYTFTIFESASGPTAYAIHYLINNSVNIYDFGARIVGSARGAGDQLQTDLPQILSTFKFVESTSSVCTQEAILCPDGSYVSRTEPNCEFASCPTP